MGPGRTPARWVLGWALVGWVVAAAPAGAKVWTDALGRSVTVPDPPRRIVSLVPSVTEILFQLGLADRVVGVTTFCDYPPEAARKPKVGGYADPSLEALVALRPELVVAAADSVKPALVSRLDALHIPVFVVYPKTLAETAETIRLLGAVTGVPARGVAEAERLLDAARQLARPSGEHARPGVLLCVMVRPLVVAGPGTLGDDLIRLAGGRNVVPPGANRYPTWGPEAVLAADPDIIVVTAHPGEEAPARIFERWPELRAVSEGRVHQLPADWIHRAGPRLAQGVRALCQVIHPGRQGGEAR
ncbi:MAG: ABC transporter substrate-binding protein [Deferrisomatales bacterium]